MIPPLKQEEKDDVTARTSAQRIIALGRTDCSGCGHCCEYGSAYLLPEDIQKLSQHFQMSKEDFLKEYADPILLFNTTGWRLKQRKDGKPYGPCILYDKEKRCTVHDVKPIYCKMGTCKPIGGKIIEWFRLHHYVRPDDEKSVQEYEEYLKHKPALKDGDSQTWKNHGAAIKEASKHDQEADKETEATLKHSMTTKQYPT